MAPSLSFAAATESVNPTASKKHVQLFTTNGPGLSLVWFANPRTRSVDDQLRARSCAPCVHREQLNMFTLNDSSLQSLPGCDRWGRRQELPPKDGTHQYACKHVRLFTTTLVCRTPPPQLSTWNAIGGEMRARRVT